MNKLRDINLFELILLIIDVFFWSIIVSLIVFIFWFFLDVFFKVGFDENFINIFWFCFFNLFLKITVDNDPTNIFNIYKKYQINFKK